MRKKTVHLGIDIGSVSLKVALLDANEVPSFTHWDRVSGMPLEKLMAVLEGLKSERPDSMIASIGVTGSGRGLVCDAIRASPVNEISAHAKAAAAICPGIRTIIEIGGQDSKLVVLNDDGTIRDFRMNELCAAGTGAFLDQQAARLNLSIEDFASLAERSNFPVPIAGRCAVFAKTDMTHHQQEGRSLPDIIQGLNEALVRSYLANLVRGIDLPTPIAFQGGVASNSSLVRVFGRMLKLKAGDLIVPKNHLTMGAVGAALAAKQKGHPGLLSFNSLIERLKGLCNRNEVHAYAHTKKLIRPDNPAVEFRPRDLDVDGYYLGIDIGSVSTKIAIIGPDGLTFSDYRLSNGRPLEYLLQMISEMRKELKDIDLDGVGITGSGRTFIGKLIGADVIHNEITSQVRACRAIMPDADTVMEIGGQDAKFMRTENGRATHFSMNRVCAAGTGAFLQEQAARLNIDLEGEFAEAAFSSGKPAALGARCTVFMESDLVSHQQAGFKKCDLVAGLAISVVTNYLDKVVAGHPVGERVLFLGGVAENRSVASALSSTLQKEIRISTVGKLSGAIGAALLASDAKRRGDYSKTSFILNASQLDFEQFNCDDCPNRCLITRTKGPSPRLLGGRCGKWEGTAGTAVAKDFQPLKLRTSLLEGNFNPAIPEFASARLKIGIPRALLAFDKLPAWRTFFEALGHRVTVSPPTNKKILEEGLKHLVVETCLPVKAFCSHILWLQTEGNVDSIFVPSIVSTGIDSHRRETFHCPYIQSLVQFANPIVKKTILNPVINWKWHPKDEEKEMTALAIKLGHSRKDAKRAWNTARDSQHRFQKELKAIGANVLEKLKNKVLERAFVILGKDYNIADEHLNSHATQILIDRGETAITQDMLADDSAIYPERYRTMYWSHGKEILTAAWIAANTKGLYPIMITSFGCGPDSFTLRFLRDIMGDKPFLILEVDEHSSSVGMETRIEAFLDSLPKSARRAMNAKRRCNRREEAIRKVFLPNFSDHGMAFAAAIRSLGFTPVLTDLPDEGSEHVGLKHATDGECHPYALLLGGYIKASESCDDLSGACYFMPDSGLCRVGQFGAQMQLIREKINSGLPIITRVDDLIASMPGASPILSAKAVIAYWEMMRGMDFLMQKFFETRAYEVEPGSAERAHSLGRKILMERIMENKPHDGLKKAISILDRVRVDKSKSRLKIGITGDYFTRVCDFANSDIFREIERLGGVVMLPPTMSEFVKYDSHQKPRWAIHHRRPGELIQSLISREVIYKKEREVRNLFGDGLDYDIPLEYDRAMKYIAPYMNKKLPPGLTGSVAAILEQIHGGAAGVLNLITFHCTYGLILGSVLSSMDRDFPEIPKLTLIFEGLKPTHNRMRLEAFMERVHANTAGGGTKC